MRWPLPKVCGGAFAMWNSFSAFDGAKLFDTCARPENQIQTKIGLRRSRRCIVKFSTQVKPISYLKSHAAEIVKDISANREPMLITQNGEAKLVVMDVKSYEEQAATLAMLKILALGQREIALGKFRNAEDVFAELDQADK
jgi:prevent-host-death family protein